MFLSRSSGYYFFGDLVPPPTTADVIRIGCQLYRAGRATKLYLRASPERQGIPAANLDAPGNRWVCLCCSAGAPRCRIRPCRKADPPGRGDGCPLSLFLPNLSARRLQYMDVLGGPEQECEANDHGEFSISRSRVNFRSWPSGGLVVSPQLSFPGNVGGCAPIYARRLAPQKIHSQSASCFF